MEIIVKVDSLSLGFPRTGFGVNVISGSYIQVNYSSNRPNKTYGIVDILSIGGNNSTIVYGTIHTDPIILNADELQAFSLSNMAGKHVDIEISGMFINSGSADIRITLIDDEGRPQVAIERKNVRVRGGQLASTQVRGRVRHIAH